VARFPERRPRNAQGDAASRDRAAQARRRGGRSGRGGRLSARVTLAYVAIGSNLGRPVEEVAQAFEDLASIAQTVLVKRSSLYRSKPLGYADQPPFVNAVALLDTALPAERLLDALQAIEAQHGRSRSFADAPRTLDLDLLLYGDAVMRQPRLVVTASADASARLRTAAAARNRAGIRHSGNRRGAGNAGTMRRSVRWKESVDKIPLPRRGRADRRRQDDIGKASCIEVIGRAAARAAVGEPVPRPLLPGHGALCAAAQLFFLFQRARMIEPLVQPDMFGKADGGRFPPRQGPAFRAHYAVGR